MVSNIFRNCLKFFNNSFLLIGPNSLVFISYILCACKTFPKSSNWAQFMLQWLITFSEFAEFTEFNESSASFRKNSSETKEAKVFGTCKSKCRPCDRDHYSADDCVITPRNESQNTCLTYRSFPVKSRTQYGLSTGDTLNPGLFTAGFIVLCFWRKTRIKKSKILI